MLRRLALVPEHVLGGLLLLIPPICTLTLVVLAIAVNTPRRRQHRPIRVPVMIGLVIGAIGLTVGVVNLVMALNS
jgi:glycerol uptake facilitator-like aquaporin